MPKSRILGPRAGWVQNASLMEPPKNSAEVLDNIFPTAAGGRIRRGRSLYATIDADAEQLMAYRGATEELFAADVDSIYDITSPADPAVAPTADVTGLTNGDWSYVNFGTSGGHFIWLVNGADSARHYNGTTWATPSITGATSSDLSQCWVHNSRIWAVEADTLSAWYLPADSVAGAMTEFPLRTIFNKGGTLLFGATWSLDSGEGPDDVCVFVTTEGQVAIYEGGDPAGTFTLAGVYDIARPLSKHAHFQAGGDIAIATEEGIISLAAAAQQDRVAISRSAITYPIEDAWRESVTLRTETHNFNCTLWHSQQMLMVSVPETRDGLKQVFVCNARTGAWCRFTGYDVQCSVVHGDQLYIGTADGEIFTAEATGADNGESYTARWLPKFIPANTVISVNAARVVYRSNVDLQPSLTGVTTFNTAVPAAPDVATDEEGDVWGVFLWGTGLWGSAGDTLTSSTWKSVYAVGDEVSVWFQTTSNRATAPDTELIGIDYLYEQGAMM